MSATRLVKNKFLIAGVLVFFHLLLISYQVPPGSETTLLEKILFSLLVPVQKAVVGSGRFLAGTWNNIKDLARVSRENQELEKEIFFLRQENRLLQEKLRLALKQADLEANLKLVGETVVPARVIGFDTSNFYRSLIINRGSADGLAKNLPVCDRFGNLIGRTAEPVGVREARVLLITSEDSGVAVISVGDRMPGILSGDGKGRCLVKYVMSSSPAGLEGDEVITSGFDRVFPPGLRVGKILQISSQEGIFKKIIVKPYFDIRELELVAVLKNTDLILR
ncbi:MAG: rod shape-determining protein MreC [Candidatus Saccharicenans sp.]|nr:rod shape-determining protein MreC [Candidatus Saccharicenans sp.]MDI6848751.1 rod shape-determining protein MreC [Candidatus Saccharicenans sp.]